MQTKKLILTLCLFCLINIVKGQNTKTDNSSDTIVIYETIVLYDTLHVYDTVRVENKINDERISEISSKPLNINDLSLIKEDDLNPDKKNSLLKSATNSKFNIIKNKDQKNFEKMEKTNSKKTPLTTFLEGAKFGIVLGGGSWWAKCSNQGESTRDISSSSTGILIEGPLSNKLDLSFEINYTKLYPDFFFASLDNEKYWLINGINDSVFNFSELSIPLKLAYKFNKIKPYAGFEYSYRKLNYSGKKSHSVNFCLGINYVWSKGFSIGINYSLGLSDEFDVAAYESEDFFSNNFVQKYQDKAKNRRLDLSLYFYLRKKPQNTIK